MLRKSLVEKLSKFSDATHTTWDVLVIGGGATGLGIALDATLRGYQTLLVEQHDFAKGTSSKSTKLVHGGVRYLAQGDVGLVIEALHERGLLLKNAPHLVKNQTFIIPNYAWWRGPFYTIGLTLYDLLAGSLSFGRSRYISRKQVAERLPTLRRDGLCSGVVYHDGQFDDARLAIDLVRTIQDSGGCATNYMKAVSLTKNANGMLGGALLEDAETRQTYQVTAKTIINATGVFVNELIQIDNPNALNLVCPSQGVHLVVDREFLPGGDALMIPHTDDGRVLFAIPWHDKVVIGTTDTPLSTPSLEPVALDEEVDFLLRTASRYLEKPVQRADVRSVFAGLRPLAAPKKRGDKKTREISRSHKIVVSNSGLITITGGKWTTYRKMAEDVIDRAIALKQLPKATCRTRDFPLHGYCTSVDRSHHLYVYGSDKPALEEMLRSESQHKSFYAEQLHSRLPYLKGEVVWGVRYELARTVEDVLARRLRALYLDARAAMEMAPTVAAIIAAELGYDTPWQETQVADFLRLAQHYVLEP